MDAAELAPPIPFLSEVARDEGVNTLPANRSSHPDTPPPSFGGLDHQGVHFIHCRMPSGSDSAAPPLKHANTGKERAVDPPSPPIEGAISIAAPVVGIPHSLPRPCICFQAPLESDSISITLASSILGTRVLRKGFPLPASVAPARAVHIPSTDWVAVWDVMDNEDRASLSHVVIACTPPAPPPPAAPPHAASSEFPSCPQFPPGLFPPHLFQCLLTFLPCSLPDCEHFLHLNVQSACAAATPALAAAPAPFAHPAPVIAHVLAAMPTLVAAAVPSPLAHCLPTTLSQLSGLTLPIPPKVVAAMKVRWVTHITLTALTNEALQGLWNNTHNERMASIASTGVLTIMPTMWDLAEQDPGNALRWASIWEEHGCMIHVHPDLYKEGHWTVFLCYDIEVRHNLASGSEDFNPLVWQEHVWNCLVTEWQMDWVN
ncbi:hypothetical protein CONPUDRAFT_152898 [Coniophora puteana RWD-64-598 SS2]|uniref:Uncharacterized protein n=1 Tax=Coniophora puteana (strain RWD-64-598) TaxID=741705 RepID=A0A5M3MTY3_CONPW|nr:uncharacterized protein CONPUDRAFT_152898 [Coniophora puteana RWD-64-598 SS2]EIW82011.1 hypothetical protein CONPUDRAFT_152898 [Coniophora puteana RWD-64-598 SS2]